MDMTVTFTPLACDHVIINATIGGKTKKIVRTKAALIEEIMEITESDIMAVLGSRIKELRATGSTWPQVKNSIEGTVFKI